MKRCVSGAPLHFFGLHFLNVTGTTQLRVRTPDKKGHDMKAIIPSLTCAALAASVALLSPALAQTNSAQGGLATVKPIAASATACATGLIEIAPVSFDTAGRPDAWVVVHRVNGEIVASQRLSTSEIEKVHRAPCGADNWRGVMLAG